MKQEPQRIYLIRKKKTTPNQFLAFTEIYFELTEMYILARPFQHRKWAENCLNEEITIDDQIINKEDYEVVPFEIKEV